MLIYTYIALIKLIFSLRFHASKWPLFLQDIKARVQLQERTILGQAQKKMFL